MRDWLIYRTFWELTVSCLVLGLIYSLVALGYTMVYGVLRLINFAHSEIFMVGTFGAIISLMKIFGLKIFENGDYPYRTGFVLIGMLVLTLVVGLAGLSLYGISSSGFEIKNDVALPESFESVVFANLYAVVFGTTSDRKSTRLNSSHRT